MAKRTTTIASVIEYVSTNLRRLSKAAVQVEYVEVNQRRASKIAVMVEYVPGTAPAVNPYGPKWQMMGD